jgi:predicted peptidase
MTLLDHIRETYSIDPQRIMVTGYSMGANGTWYMAARHPDIFSIAIPVSGTGMKQQEDLMKTIKSQIYVIHSRNDEVIPLQEVEYLVNLLKDWGLPIRFRIVEDLTHYQTTAFVPYLQEAVPWIQSIWGNK